MTILPLRGVNAFTEALRQELSEGKTGLRTTLYEINQPAHVNVNEILIRPTEQAS